MRFFAPLSLFKHGAIDIGHVTGNDPASVLALVRALRFNTFFTHVDLSTVNALAPAAWTENPLGLSSEVSGGPLAVALQVCPKSMWSGHGMGRGQKL